MSERNEIVVLGEGEDEQIARVAALTSDPHPGLLTWRAALVRALRDLGFEPIRAPATSATGAATGAATSSSRGRG